MSFPEKPNSAKRRRLNKTLLDYYPKIVKPSPLRRVEDNWYFGRLPTEVLYKSVFKFLTVQDLTSLSHSCHQLQTMVGHFRGPLPHIIREELFPHKLNYVNLEDTSSPSAAVSSSSRSSWSSANNYFEVSRARKMRFLLQTERHRVIQVEFKLGNLLWTEINHNLAIEATPSQCWVEVKIYRQVKTPGGGFERIQLFENVVTYHDDEGSLCYYLEGYDQTPEMQYKQLKKKTPPTANTTSIAAAALSLSTEANQRDCVQYLYQCARRIAQSPKQFNMPNLDYLLDQALPKSLHPYLKPYHTFDQTLKTVGPRPEAVWKHRRAESRSARRRFFQGHSTKRDQHGQLTREYNIYDIPWFRSWYPKPIVLYEKNLLQSLPPELVAFKVLPYLEDWTPLQHVCPKVAWFLHWYMAAMVRQQQQQQQRLLKRTRESDN